MLELLLWGVLLGHGRRVDEPDPLEVKVILEEGPRLGDGVPRDEPEHGDVDSQDGRDQQDDGELGWGDGRVAQVHEDVLVKDAERVLQALISGVRPWLMISSAINI